MRYGRSSLNCGSPIEADSGPPGQPDRHFEDIAGHLSKGHHTAALSHDRRTTTMSATKGSETIITGLTAPRELVAGRTHETVDTRRPLPSGGEPLVHHIVRT